MTFEEARAHVVSAVRHAAGAKDDARLAQDLASSDRDISLADLEFDSLAAMEVCMTLEEETNIEIDLGDMLAYPSVNRLAKILVERSGKN